MLSFVVEPLNQTQVIQIYCDEAGISALVDTLNRLPEAGHLHLRAPKGPGRTELSGTSPFGDAAISEVIITYCGD
jgi:hypothetical protein